MKPRFEPKIWKQLVGCSEMFNQQVNNGFVYKTAGLLKNGAILSVLQGLDHWLFVPDQVTNKWHWVKVEYGT